MPPSPPLRSKRFIGIKISGAGHSAPFVLRGHVDDNAVKTLFLPFELEAVSALETGDRWLFLNASVPLVGAEDFRPFLTCVQGFRPSFLDLERAGYTTLPELDASTDFAGALVLLGKHRGENRRIIHLALDRVLKGAPVLIAGAKTSGIESMRKEMAALLPIEASWSKHHAIVFRLTCTANYTAPLHETAARIEANGLSFETSAGMFSHKSVDAGSALLAEHLGGLKGHGADFGAGWGYLSCVALSKSEGIRTLHLFEADYASLSAAQANVTDSFPNALASFSWSDLAQELPKDKFDFIFMNPPFHAGRHAEAGIGKRFIEVAAASLKPGGQLLMVANKPLPYEDALQKSFRRFERIGEDKLYKVIRAVR
jgi:16S rRNA (guanine1207-N2)-methyltransferase